MIQINSFQYQNTAHTILMIRYKRQQHDLLQKVKTAENVGILA